MNRNQGRGIATSHLFQDANEHLDGGCGDLQGSSLAASTTRKRSGIFERIRGASRRLVSLASLESVSEGSIRMSGVWDIALTSKPLSRIRSIRNNRTENGDRRSKSSDLWVKNPTFQTRS